MSIEPNIEMMAWAIGRNGFTPNDLLSFPKLHEWLSGTKRPTMKQLEDFAHKVHIPLPYFFGTVYPNTELPIPDFRTVSGHSIDEPSLELLETIEAVSYRLSWLSEHRINQGHEPLEFIGSLSAGNDPLSIAETSMMLLGLEPEWAFSCRAPDDAIRLFRRRLEDLGITVNMSGVVGTNNYRPLNVNEFRGFVLSDAYAPFIFVNSRDTDRAKLFTLAHEFVHLLMGRTGLLDYNDSGTDRSQDERLCDKAASLMLVNPDSLQMVWKTLVIQNDDLLSQIITISKKYKVSSMVVARRLFEDAIIDRQSFSIFLSSYDPHTERRRPSSGDGGNPYHTRRVAIGGEFAQAVNNAAKSGSISYVEAFRLTGMTPKMYDGYFIRNGGSE